MSTYTPSLASASPGNSTTVRSATPRAPWPARLSFATLSAISPRIAAHIAERRFLTPPRYSQPPHERDALARGTPTTVRDVAGHRVRAWRFGDGPAVLLVHGWGGRGGQMAAWLEPIEDAGFSAITFDAPAHGASSGRLASVPLFSRVIADLARHFGARAIVAHSMGAAALALAIGSGLEIDAAVLIAPPRSPTAFLERFETALGLSPAVVGAVRCRLERRYGVPLEQLHVPPRVAHVTSPMLVVHDADDREVPWSDGAAIAQACPGARLFTTNGLGHRRILRDPGVVRRGVEFVRARGGRGPRPRMVPVPGIQGTRHA